MNARESKMRTVLANRLSGLRIICEALHLRHNVSAILRTAESFGVHHVHLIQPEKAKMSSAARGAERWLSIHVHSSLEECIEVLHQKNYKVWVADIDNNACTPHGVPIDDPIAILMGTELTGVSHRAKELSDGCIYVPMLGFTQSLNVSVAAACILHTLSYRLQQKENIMRLSTREQEEQTTLWKLRDQQDNRRMKNKIKIIEEMPLEPVSGGDHSH